MPSFSSRNSALATEIKNHAKMDIKLSFSSPILLDFCILFQTFCLGCLSKQVVGANSAQSP